MLTNRIRELRALHGRVSQEGLGQYVGITRQTLAAIEAGKCAPSLELAFRIAYAFDLPLDEVFQWINESD